MTQPRRLTVGDALDRFVPIRKSDILGALIKQQAFADDAEREKFHLLCDMLASIYHYEYFATLERLRNDYYYFNPEIVPHAAIDEASIARSYADLVQTLDALLKDANFIELPHAEIGDAHRRRTVLRVEVKAPLADFREVRFYRRGRHVEPFEVAEWFGLRRRKIEAEVFDDVVMLAAMKSQAEIGSRREVKALERRKMRPGSVLLKCFRNIASGDLNALFPNVRVVMSNADKLFLGVPALAGGIPILINVYTTVTVLFLVLGFYLGVSAAVEDKDMKTALAALSGLVALGGFVLRQWVKYQRRSLKYRIELIDNIYYRNVNNNAGVFDYVIGVAEEQECKSAFLAYHFLRAAPAPPTADELAGRIDAWLGATFGVDADFKLGAAPAKLEQLGLLKRQGERLSVAPLDPALAQLHRVWDDFFPAARPVAAE
ncbi:MAG TPA: TMEM143 family protein [Xanthobacteraceae bacterium]|nr:TMEM143 family protein [Xanthobacteraceae bacterium]